jgi:hypothetical protein
MFRSIASHKGHFTRTLATLDTFIKDCQGKPTKQLGRLIEQYLTEGEERMKKIEHMYCAIIDQTKEEDTSREATAALERELDRRDKMRADVSKSLGALYKKLEERAAIELATEIKVKKELKPPELTKDATMPEMRAWLTQFKRYYKASQMHRACIEEQRGHFNACLSIGLQATLEARADEEMPIFEEEEEQDWTENSCMGIIVLEFHARNPVTTRRCNALKLRQPRGQKWSEFWVKARQTIDDAELYGINYLKLEAIILINACTDDELKKLFLEKEEATVEELGRIAENYERRLADMKGTNESEQRAYSVNKEHGRRSNNNKEKEREPICFRCGKKGHTVTKCSVSASIICNFCEKKGHKEIVCRSKASAEKKPRKDSKKAQQLREADSSDDSDTTEVEFRVASTNRARAHARSLRDGADTPKLLL